jgi:hypothetical protein
VRGQCLCGDVAFELDLQELRLYRCHCSLCRRQSGTASNCAAIVDTPRFRWLRGQAAVASWTRETGFRSDFCSRCGSPVPNPLRNLDCYWVPAGLLEGDGQLAVIADFHMSSKALWDTTSPSGQQFVSLPSLEEFLALMHNK